MNLQKIIKQIKPAVVAISGVERRGTKGFIFDIVGSGFNLHPDIYLPEENGVRIQSGISFAVPINYVKNHIYSKFNIDEEYFHNFQKIKLPEHA